MYKHMGATQRYETQNVTKQLRLTYHPELRKGIEGRVSGEAIHWKVSGRNVNKVKMISGISFFFFPGVGM